MDEKQMRSRYRRRRRGYPGRGRRSYGRKSFRRTRRTGPRRAVRRYGRRSMGS